MNRTSGTIEIAGKAVGLGQRVFVIAEAGVNHNGDIGMATSLISAAAAAGADAVKFQTWVTEELITESAPLAAYQERNTGGRQTQFEMLKQLELSRAALESLISEGAKKSIIVFSTPDEERSADVLSEMDIPVFKIGSAEVTNLSFLRHVAMRQKPIILSTGMADLGEVEKAVHTIESTGNRNLVLLHCVSNYPAEPAECNLRAMETLKVAFGYPVGFSDHTVGTEVPIAAVAAGACVIEKHLTLDKGLPGPDHAASLDPDEFRRMVESIRKCEAALGNSRKEPTASELAHRPLMRKRWVANCPLAPGTVLSQKNLALRRADPRGLDPGQVDLLLGRMTARAIPAWQVITLDMLQ